MVKISTEGYPVNVTKKFARIVEDAINAGNVATDGGVIVNFRDPEYSADQGGYHPVEVMVSKDGWIRYVTDFAFVGQPPFAELAKELDFDFSQGLFQQMGRDYPIQEGRSLFRTWQANFCDYHKSGVFEVEVSAT